MLVRAFWIPALLAVALLAPTAPAWATTTHGRAIAADISP